MTMVMRGRETRGGGKDEALCSDRCTSGGTAGADGWEDQNAERSG